MTNVDRVLRVALNTPLNTLFDYRAPAEEALPGSRVRVPFGRRHIVGVVTAAAANSDVPANKLKSVEAVVDQEPLLDAALLELLQWASRYYQHPPGEVIAAALPVALRQGATAEPEVVQQWQLTDAGRDVDTGALARKAPVQAALIETLREGPREADALRTVNANWRKTMQSFIERGWVTVGVSDSGSDPIRTEAGPELTEAQRAAIDAVQAEGFSASLLEGVTGSGKTEVYLKLIEQQIAAGRQALVLVPEIGLTPQLLDRFRRRLGGSIAVLHSSLTDAQRRNHWLRARSGEAGVIIGTRSAVFAPLPNPGIVIVDEEHDASFKQQDGFRYSARDIAVYRARQLGIPVVLGSATPALETLHNAVTGRYAHLRLPERPGSATQPDVHLIDLRKYPPTDGISQPLLDALRRHLDAGNQVLVYLNRRGFAPTLLCPTCGTTVECDRCDARLVLHQQRNRLICHHCGHERPAPPTCGECGDELVPVGLGTERLETALRDAFRDHTLVRIDRDTTRKRGELERLLGQVRDGEAQILLGTQMLTKGHDFPNVTCVAIVDSDQGLFGTDFRSGERLAQSVLQVAGRAGRGDKPGEVWLQTLYPEHPWLRTLLYEGYDAFAAQALDERAQTHWPPFAHLALLRAECVRKKDLLYRFLDAARNRATGFCNDEIRLLGPASSPMERRGGRYRAQLLIHSTHRGRLQQTLPAIRDAVASLDDARRVRWSLDVDPLEMF